MFVFRHVVDTFDNVDFAAAGPLALPQCPEGGPGSAGITGHVQNVCDDEAMLKVAEALETDSLSASRILGRDLSKVGAKFRG